MKGKNRRGGEGEVGNLRDPGSELRQEGEKQGEHNKWDKTRKQTRPGMHEAVMGETQNSGYNVYLVNFSLRNQSEVAVNITSSSQT